MSQIIFPSGRTELYMGTIPKGWRVRRTETKQGVRTFYLERSYWSQAKQLVVNLIVRLGDWAHGYKPNEKEK